MTLSAKKMSSLLILFLGLSHLWAQQRETEYAERADIMPRAVNTSRQGWPQALTDSERAAQTRGGNPELYDESVFRTIELTFAVSDWHEQLQNNWTIHDETGEDIYVSADLLVDGVTYSNVGVQYKGNSSYWFVEGYKKPYKITMDAFVPDQEIYGFDKLTLNNGVWDPTLVREIICYKIMREFMPAPRANMVRVRSGTADHKIDVGVYVSVERVNKRFLDKHLGNDGGHRYKAVSGSMTWLGDDVTSYQGGYSISGGDESTQYLDLIHVIDTLNNTPSGTLKESLDPLFSIDRAIRQITAGIALLNWDDLRAFAPNGHNYYLYQQTNQKPMIILPWDWDLGLSGEADEDIRSQFGDPDIPVVKRLMEIPELDARYLAFLRMMGSRLDWTVTRAWVENFRKQAEATILAGQHELYTADQYHESHRDLEALLVDRFNFLANHAELNQPIPTIEEVAHLPQAPIADEVVTVTAKLSGSAPLGSVLLYWRSEAAFQTLPMADDGKHGDDVANDGIYGAQIPAQSGGKTVAYYIEASTDAVNGGAVWYEPIYTEHAPFSYQVGFPPINSTLFINEFVAKNDQGIMDEQGEFEDWLELYNGGAEAIDLDGYYLTDDLSEPNMWRFPAVMIQPGEYLLVWCDKDLEDGPLHADFKLSTGGEQIGLFSPTSLGTQLLDSYQYEEQAADVSEGRVVDAGAEWTFFTVPTPARSNHLAPDFTGDGILNLLDMASLVSSFGSCAAPCSESCPADLNLDCTVDLSDMLISLSYWSDTP